MQVNYSTAQLYKIADENYEILRKYCLLLDDEGYWEGPRSVLNQSIYDMLDLYVQTVLLKFALYCGEVTEEEREFIARVTRENVLSIERDEPVSQPSMDAAQRFFTSPPILLQLCGLRDTDRSTSVLGLFFDAMMNIQLAMAFLTETGVKKITGFIREYYYSIEVFLYNKEQYTAAINEKYIFLKLCSGILEKSSEYLQKAGEDFESYKKIFVYETSGGEDDKTADSKVELPLEKKDININVNKTEESADAEKNQNEQDKNIKKKSKKMENQNNKSKLDELLLELNSLIGLENVKKEINSLINLIKVRSMRQKQGLPALDMSYHMVFTGSPGTGKTTVARLVAGIYRELGLLSRGNLVETDRSGLVAGYVGQTALKVKEVVERAIGGVLFIDEAYSLSGSIGTNDFGGEAIETLVKLMEDNRDNLVVIVAGYTDEMKRFLKANTGLMSRFNKFIEFKDYNDDELVDIMKAMASKSGFVVEDDVCSHMKESIAALSEQKRSDFGNARGIRNAFERLVVNQANRVVEIEEPTIDDLTHITLKDVTQLS